MKEFMVRNVGRGGEAQLLVNGEKMEGCWNRISQERS